MVKIMRTLTIIELPTGGFILMGGTIDQIIGVPEEGPISVCPELGATYDYPNTLKTLPGAVREFFAPPEPTKE